MDYETAGDPINGLKWTHKTAGKIAGELQSCGIIISDKSVSRILKSFGFSLQANCKKIALTGNGTQQQRQERDEQFLFISAMRKKYTHRKQPVISIDTKKKELIGNFKNAGRCWRSKPCNVSDHDFPSYADGKAIPYGIYDTISNTGFVSVGISHDTPAFAVDSICTWWEQEGKNKYSEARRILILADSGGSNRPTSAAWKYHLWESFCNTYGMEVTVCHYPSGASKWNPIEHRLFSEISKNWAGIPLVSIRTVLNYIRTTSTQTGLQVRAFFNKRKYETKEKISKENIAKMKMHFPKIQCKLNYTLYPSKC